MNYDVNLRAISFVSRLWEVADCLRVEKAYPDATDFHRQLLPLFAV